MNGPVCRLPSGRIVGCEYRDGDPATSIPHQFGCQCERCEPQLADAIRIAEFSDYTHDDVDELRILSRWREQRFRRWLWRNRVVLPKPDPRVVVRNEPVGRR